MGNLDESFEFKGFFWLPETPDVEIPGTITYTPDDGVHLELQGILHAPADNSFHPPTFKDAPLILGVTSQGKEVSLLDCFQIRGTVGSGWKYLGTPETAYRVTRAFIDVHFLSIEVVKFKEITVEYTYLDEWFDQNPFQVDHPSRSEVTLRYKAPESCFVKVGEYSISFTVAGPITERASMGKFIVSQEVRVKIECDVGEKRLDDFFLLMRRMQDLLTLGVGEPVFPTGILAISSANKQVLDNGKEFKPPVQVYYALPWRPKSPRNISSPQMVFTSKVILDRPDIYLANWFVKAEELKPILDIYFSLLYRENIYSEFRLLGLVQAIETYHRRRYNGKYQSDDEYLSGLYPQFLKSLPQDMNESFRQSLAEGKLRYANEYSLRKRLIDLTRHFDKNVPFKFLTVAKERNIFIERVCNTRNYFTHYNPVLSSKAAKRGKRLYDLNNKLRALLEALLLEEIGFEQAHIGDMIKKNQYYSDLI